MSWRVLPLELRQRITRKAWWLQRQDVISNLLLYRSNPETVVQDSLYWLVLVMKVDDDKVMVINKRATSCEVCYVHVYDTKCGVHLELWLRSVGRLQCKLLTMHASKHSTHTGSSYRSYYYWSEWKRSALLFTQLYHLM